MAGTHGWDENDLQALQILRPLLDGSAYLPWTEGALRPAALATIANEIVFGDRRQIVELGAGVSTIVLGRLLRERGGRLTSLEHDPNWARVVRSQLQLEGLEARLVEAPLEPAAEGAPWYARAALAELPVEGIDLLLVDGPPGYGEGMECSRYPALPALAERLAPGALVVLDDAGREGEREVVARWARELPAWEFATSAAEGIAIGRRAIEAPGRRANERGRMREWPTDTT